MMAGNPNWWSIKDMHPQSHQVSSQFVYGSNSSIPASTTAADQDFPVRSWSQLLLGGLGSGEEEKFSGDLFQQQKKMENWEDEVVNLNPCLPRNNNPLFDVKEEVAQSSSSQLYEEEFQPNKPSNSWPRHHPETSCITTSSNNIFFNFSGEKTATLEKNHQHNQDHSSEGNSTNSGGVSKKARVQHYSAQPVLKVRKEKLGDRITALHQLVSPFGKTDTASVLSEAIGYIRFLQSQIEALSSPYMLSTASLGTAHRPQHPDSQSLGVKDLRSKGLCLVPISCTQNVENDNGPDYCAPPTLGGGF